MWEKERGSCGGVHWIWKGSLPPGVKRLEFTDSKVIEWRTPLIPSTHTIQKEKEAYEALLNEWKGVQDALIQDRKQAHRDVSTMPVFQCPCCQRSMSYLDAKTPKPKVILGLFQLESGLCSECFLYTKGQAEGKTYLAVRYTREPTLAELHLLPPEALSADARMVLSVLRG